MRRTTAAVGVACAVLLATGHESQAQRGRGGFAGARGSAGGFAGGGYGSSTRAGGTVIGPAGGTRSAGAGSGSYTTQRGTTINYGAAGRGGTTPGGVNYGRGVGGVQVTTPGGREVTKVGTAGGISGPAGNGIGGARGVTTGSGTGGSFGSAYRGGVAVGPGGAVAGGTRVGAATGVGGATVAGATRGAAAVGPYGAAAYRGGVAVGAGGAVAGRATVARGASGTFYASRTTLVATGGAVRTNFGYYRAFTPTWYARYPGAWFAVGWTTARIWSAPAWNTMAIYCGYPAEPVYYDYGETVVYSADTVTINGETEVPAETYAQGAADLAAAGAAAKVEPKGDDFQPLGVFAMVGEGETKSTNIFQLAVNKDGVIRGNYYNALTDTTEPVYGSVDQKTQRAAWTVADRKNPVYEVGIANLTRDETTMLVHYFKSSVQQFTLVRVRQPEGEPADGK